MYQRLRTTKQKTNKTIKLYFFLHFTNNNFADDGADGAEFTDGSRKYADEASAAGRLNLASPVPRDSVVRCLGGHHAWSDAHGHELLEQKLAGVRQAHQRDLRHRDEMLDSC